jgi:hypothetical protein
MRKNYGFMPASIRNPYKQVVRELCRNYEGFFFRLLGQAGSTISPGLSIPPNEYACGDFGSTGV